MEFNASVTPNLSTVVFVSFTNYFSVSFFSLLVCRDLSICIFIDLSKWTVSRLGKGCLPILTLKKCIYLAAKNKTAKSSWPPGRLVCRTVWSRDCSTSCPKHPLKKKQVVLCLKQTRCPLWERLIEFQQQQVAGALLTLLNWRELRTYKAKSGLETACSLFLHPRSLVAMVWIFKHTSRHTVGEKTFFGHP